MIIIESDPTLRNNLMAFGRECDEGWNELIDELIEKLDKLPEEIYVTQIKEKYGTLRFYVASCSEEAQSIIDDYETFSSHICEKCGEFYTAKLREKNSWCKTLCHHCADELNYE